VDSFDREEALLVLFRREEEELRDIVYVLKEAFWWTALSEEGRCSPWVGEAEEGVG
jgi:hypothetical protein